MSVRVRAVLAALLTLVSGCATPIVDVVVRADAPSVRVLEGPRTLAAGRPPLTLHLAADVDHDLVVTADGREAKPVRLVSTVSGAKVAVYVVQCLFGIGLVMMPIVLSRGVLRTLDPTEVDVTLGPGNGPGPRPTSPPTPPTQRPTPPPPPPTQRPAPPPPSPRPADVPPPQEARVEPTPPGPGTFCGGCGVRRSDGARFCGSCGAPAR